MNDLNNIIFYQMDKAIRSYRQMAQNRFRQLNIDVTIDQWIILKTLSINPDATQMDLAEKVFKDNASVTRMLNLLVENGYISRSISKNDRRRMDLKITKKGHEIMTTMDPIILENRAIALNNLREDDLDIVRTCMSQIAENCLSHSDKT